MPELPEVQTVITDLQKKIIGYKIINFWSNWPKTIKSHSFNNFKKIIVGKKIIKVWRLGKNIFIDLTNNKTIYIHLKMTGHLLVKNITIKNNKFFQEKVNQYIHHRWFLNKGQTIEFSDVRKFAKIVLVDTNKVLKLKEITSLGVDLMDKNFTLKKFKEILSKVKKKTIGIVLMEQNLLAGIGNIYRSEILFVAKISPFRLVGKLKEKEIEVLYKAIKKILKKAIELRGTSDSDYRDTAGKTGQYQKRLKVYRRGGKKCFGCNSKIKREKMGNRTIFYCLNCQK